MTYQCSGCGYRTARWIGFCPQCRGGALHEIGDGPVSSTVPVSLDSIVSDDAVRIGTGLGEVDRVLGGGLVIGSAVLLGGEPGVGKSTLVLQVAAAIARRGGTALLATAEESAMQVGLRARRLGSAQSSVQLITERDVDVVLAAARSHRPDLLVLDSVQAVTSGGNGGGAGGVGQVRECAARLVQFAKDEGVAVVMVGHVTKDGGIAGPKVVEHLVDVVLYLEGEVELGMRVLRSIKNRFGATHHAGLFEMGEAGLTEVADPSQALVGDWRGTVPGTVVFPTLEGRRPLLVEIQALVSPTTAPQPRRSVRGLEPARIHQLLAVLDRHAGLCFSTSDVYVGAVGGVRVREPAADLPVALALASSLVGRPLGSLAAWGEVGLTGEVRPVADAARRRAEADRLGVSGVVAPDRAQGMRIGWALAEAGFAAEIADSTLPAASMAL